MPQSMRTEQETELLTGAQLQSMDESFRAQEPLMDLLLVWKSRGADPRWLAIATTHLQQAFMFARAAIANEPHNKPL